MGEAELRAVKRMWLIEEMRYEWSPRHNAFVNVDLELELGRSDPRLKAAISREFITKKLSLATFQRAVKILVDRARQKKR